MSEPLWTIVVNWLRAHAWILRPNLQRKTEQRLMGGKPNPRFPSFLCSPLTSPFSGTESAAMTSSPRSRQALWCHQQMVKPSDPPTPEKPPPTFPFPPPRGRARSGQTVFSLFCQQSFLKEIFFQRNCFCLILYGCLGTLVLSLSLSFSLSASRFFSLPAQ